MAVKLGLVGTGTVGGGCIDIIQAHREDFKRHYGIDIELTQVCSRNPEQALEHSVDDIFTQDYSDLINNQNIDLIIELIGGTGVAKQVVMDALNAGKHVVTANKALMATSGEEILSLAAKKNLEVAYEASVGGGIPIIDPLKHSLIANEISSVIGIVNGTTNYMLTRMIEDNMSYDDALAEAQDKGFAEADPTADVDGFDAAAKIAILASRAFHARVALEDVYTEGIRKLTTLDLETTHDMGYAVKLLAIAHRTDTGIDVRVHPTMIPLTHQLAMVNGVYNAIYVTGDAVGETMFFGEGAGAGAAASAVMGDVLEIARHITLGSGPLMGESRADDVAIMPIEDLKTKYYIRFSVADRIGVLASIASVFAKYNVSLLSVVQRGHKDATSVDLVYVTHIATEKAIRSVLDEIEKLDDILRDDPVVIRVEED